MPAQASNAPNALMACVECGHPIAYIYKEYSRGNIRLSRCRKCRSIADKYVEFETVLVFIDMMLQKVGVYRHLLVNRQPHAEHRGGTRLPTLWRLVLALLALDVYTKLYLHTLATVRPDLNNHVWLPVLAPHTAARGGDGTCYATHAGSIDLLQQHTSMQAVVAESKQAMNRYRAGLCGRWGCHAPSNHPAGQDGGAGTGGSCAPMADGNVTERFRCAGNACSYTLEVPLGASGGAVGEAGDTPGGGNGTHGDACGVELGGVCSGGGAPDTTTAAGEGGAVATPSPPATPVASDDISESMWSLPNLPSLLPTMAAASMVELVAYCVGVLVALRVLNPLAWSRLRLDPATGLPRVPAPRSRRSITAVSTVAGSVATGGGGGHDSSEGAAAPAPVLAASGGDRDTVGSLPPQVRLPPHHAGLTVSTHGPATNSNGASGAGAGVAAGLASPPGGGGGYRLHRSISTGNTAAAEAIRQEMLAQERSAGGDGAAAGMTTPPRHASGVGAGHRGAAPSGSGGGVGDGLTEAVSTPTSGVTSGGGVMANPAVGMPPARRMPWQPMAVYMTPGGIPTVQQDVANLVAWVKSASQPVRDVIDSSPPTLREYIATVQAILISDFPKLFVCATMVWTYPATFVRVLYIFTLASNVTALTALLDCSLVQSGLLVACGTVCSVGARLALWQVGCMPWDTW